MKALITGASSGIGYEISTELARLGYDVVIVARRVDKLNELKSNLIKNYNINVYIEAVDLTLDGVTLDLYNKHKDIDILVNNAGFGLYGYFENVDLEREIKMIDLNIRVLHELTKYYLRDFKARDKGYILNVASLAGYIPGPLMATYFATKAYVLHLTEAIWVELKRRDSNVKISALCPGPVKTEFGDVAKVSYNSKVGGLNSTYVAKYAVNYMFKGKRVIIPGDVTKTAKILRKMLPTKIVLDLIYSFQNK